jgi:hypothetical protein
MRINKSTHMTSKIAGETLVSYKLARRGWTPISANSGYANFPNLDLIAIKPGKRVTIQVKAAIGRQAWVMFAGRVKATEPYFNGKEGERADFIACVRLQQGKDDADCYVMPAEAAERLAREHARNYLAKPKQDGSAREANFPIWIKQDAIAQWRDAWHILDSQ